MSSVWQQRGTSTLTPLRIDARRNRQTILRIADEAFAQGCHLVPLEEIARRAGLGRATVYRHFPDRQALGTAVAAQQLETLRLVVDAEGERYSFRDLLHMVLSEQVSRRPLVHLFREFPAREQRQYADALIAMLTPALRRAQAEGQLRDDIEPADLLRVIHMIEAAVGSEPADTDHDAATRRLIALVLDGLSAPSPSR